MSHHLLPAPTAGGALIKCVHAAALLSDAALKWEVLRAGIPPPSRLLCTPDIVLHWGIEGPLCSRGFGEFTWEIWC